MLSDRRQRILCALIEEYVAYALPVGSRTLTERYGLGVSSATVRNDLSALEEAGYITQPHTSAGRIPTDAGYRAFVDDLLASELAQDTDPHSDVVNELRRSATELDDLLERTSTALTKLSDCLSIVVAPSVYAGHIRQISLISLSNYQALIVIVAEDGQVVNRSVTFAEEVSPDELAQEQAILAQLFTGKSPRDVCSAPSPTIPASIDGAPGPLTRLLVEEVLTCLREHHMGRTHRLGVSTLLRKPEFSSAQSLLPLMEVLEDDTVLFHVVGEPANAHRNLNVVIGSENATTKLAGVSVIAGTYGRGEGEGIVAVIGPTRMDYSRVIRAVRAAQNALDDSNPYA